MTGLEPHPVFTMPPLEEIEQLGPEAFAKLVENRRTLMEREQEDPLNHGFHPAVWDLMDDLLVDGKRVCLVDYPGIVPADMAKTTARAQFELVGRRELLAHGANGASKSEYAAQKTVRILTSGPGKRTWAFHETAPESISRQQPLFFKYLPVNIRRLVQQIGRFKQGVIANVSYSQKNGFTENTFVLPGGSQNWFKNYAQEEQTIEGDQIDGAWLDELAPLTLLKTVRFRLVRRKGILILTFTPIKGWTPTVQEYNDGAKTLLEVPAELLPVKDATGAPTGEFEQVPRVKIAGPGTDGNLKANVVYLHSSDNPYFDKAELFELLRGARRELILERAYGVATKAFANKFPRFSVRAHVIPPDKVPAQGTNYHIADPVFGRPWFMLWIRVLPNPIYKKIAGEVVPMYRRIVYREWPSTGHTGPSAYIPGIGDPGPWAVPGNAADGVAGSAQDSNGWGLDRYRAEIDRLEGRASDEEAEDRPKVKTLGEEVMERRMDSRYGNTPTQSQGRETTLIELMSEQGIEFLPASGRDIGEGVQMINDALDYDEEVPIGGYSPKLSRINVPLLQISEECPNLIYALLTWTGKDKGEGATKDPIDDLRYAFQGEMEHIGADAFTWQGPRVR